MSQSPFDPHARHYVQCMPFGAHLLGAKGAEPRTRFRFWAPDRRDVQLQIEQAGEVTLTDMKPAGNGWFEAEMECGAGTRYRYRLEANLAVPDPASRFQPDDVHGPSEVIDARAYEWQNTDWHGRPWEEMVLYELHVGALGGYAGVQKRLPLLADLGITGIELMPLGDFPGKRNWGYDGVLPYAPDSSYGRPDELKALVDCAHGLGLAVLLDVVYNHLGPDGNYLREYAQAFFRNDIATPWGPAIDFSRPEVRDFFCENALYWINEYCFDGLRLDAVHAIIDTEWLRELADHVHAQVKHGRHVHLVLENEHNEASLMESHFDAQWNDDAHNALHVLLTGEQEGYYRAFADKPIEKLARVLAEGFAYQGDASPAHGGKARGEPSAHLPPTAFVVFLQNHDQIGNRAHGERLRSLCAPQALLAATGLVLLTPQIPLLFMDEENGSTQPFMFFTDYTGELGEAVREGRRREFAKFSAFSDEAARARIPDPNAPETFALSSPPDDSASDPHDTHGTSERDAWRHFYKSALAVRAKLITPRLSPVRALGARILRARGGLDTNALVASWRLADGETLSLALNLTPDTLPFAERPDGMVIFETPPRVRDSVNAYTLPPYSFIAWLTGDVNTYALRHDGRVVHEPEPQA